jgi:hypothetical protein
MATAIATTTFSITATATATATATTTATAATATARALARARATTTATAMVGGPVGKFPAICFVPPQLLKMNSEKKQNNGTNHGLTTALFPPNPISMHCLSLPLSSRNLIPFANKLPMQATSLREAYQG